MPRWPTSGMTVEERFWAKVEKRGEDECWLWTGELKWPNKPVKGSIQGGCYGKFYIKFKRGEKTIWSSAHRMAWRLTHGEIPDSKVICHACDNPRCCNPKHLWMGTQIENIADRHRKGRTRVGRTGGKFGPKTAWSESELWHARQANRAPPDTAASERR